MKYIVVSGTTRRLITADDPREARVKFLTMVPRAHLLAVPYEACEVYEATSLDVLEFLSGRTPHFDDQMALDLGDVQKPQSQKLKDPRG